MRVAHVAHGQGPHFVAPGEYGVGALDRPFGFFVHLADFAQVSSSAIPHRLGVGQGNFLGSLDHDGLKVLGAHDRADSRTASGPALQAADYGVKDLLLSGLADGEYPGGLAIFFLQPILGFIGALAPYLFGGEEADLIVLDEHIFG